MSTKPQTRLRTQATRQDFALYVYLSMGVGRSIAATAEAIRKMSVLEVRYKQYVVGAKQLERYSRTMGWVEIARTWDEDHTTANVQDALDAALATDAEQIETGRLMQRVGIAALEAKLNDDGTLKGEFGDGASIRSIAEGIRIQRLASGQVTDRRELLVGVWNRLTVEMPPVFDAALALLPRDRPFTDAELARVRATFAIEFDAVVDRSFVQLGIEVLESGE